MMMDYGLCLKAYALRIYTSGQFGAGRHGLIMGLEFNGFTLIRHCIHRRSTFKGIMLEINLASYEDNIVRFT